MSQKDTEITIDATRASALALCPKGLRLRMQGPGGYYNLGNIIGFVVGAAQALLADRPAEADASLFAAMGEHLAGSSSAVALSVAMVLFFASGEVYHKAWETSRQPRIRLVRLGDLLSAIAALVLCVSLVLVGNVALGLLSSALLVGGKLGSAFMPSASWIIRPPYTPPFDPFRIAVVASRLPALLAISVVLVTSLVSGAQSPDVLLQQLTLLVCYGLWLRADLMLFRAR